MNRITNNPDLVVEDALGGYFKAHGRIIAPAANPRVVRRAGAATAGRVGLVTGGGSGHEPSFLGYVGEGLLDAAAIGEIFSSPTARSFLDAIEAANGGRGVVCLYGNYAGDNMNVKMAIRMAKEAGIEVRAVVANDDVASAPIDERDRRRGVAGQIFMWKVAGAKAGEGAHLDDVVAAAQRAIDATRSVGIGLAPCTIPAVGHPNFTINDGEMEFGIGLHGEPGAAVLPIRPANDMADMMVDAVMAELADAEDVAILVSGLGATPVMEAHVIYDRVSDRMAQSGRRVKHSFVGNYCTSLDMMGVTLTVMKLDEELDRLMSVPARSIGLVVP